MWQIYFQRWTFGILMLCCSFWVTAQTYPNKTITLVVPFAPGGNIDVIARSIAPSLAKVTGQSVVVENKAGAGGAIGSTYVARAEPDGHTLLDPIAPPAPALFSTTTD